MVNKKHKHVNLQRLKSWCDANLETVLDYIFPNGKRICNDLVVGSIYGEAGESLRVCLSGSKRGQWIDFANDEDKGDIIELWMKVFNKSFYESISALSEFAGGDITNEDYIPRVKPQSEIDAERVALENEVKSKKANMNRHWKDAKIASSTKSFFLYLETRGINIDKSQVSKDIRVHSHFSLSGIGEKKEKIGVFPCIFALSRDVNGIAQGMQRIYFNKDGTKIDTKSPVKKMLSVSRKALSGCAVHLTPESSENEIMCISEGVETGYAIVSALPELPVRATLSTGNMLAFVPPEYVKKLIIAVDYDRSGGGIQAAIKLKDNLAIKSPELEVVLCVPDLMDIPEGQKSIDYADLDASIIRSEIGAFLPKVESDISNDMVF